MASAFIIRPFGTKEGIDFERVERELIDPALSSHHLLGRTTADSLKQGNIRLEMYHRLLTADVVIADISIPNANVFYELGIRHALRTKRTFLIRGTSATLPTDDVPFDIRTDRYLVYDTEDPAATLGRLRQGLRETLLSMEKDSPVFQQLPELLEQDRARFLTAPKEFWEEVECARTQNTPRDQLGDLRLLQHETTDFPWQIAGLRTVGRVQVGLRANGDACETWENVLRQEPDDKEANIWLGTIYQRLGRLTKSSLALDRVLANTLATQAERAEAYALKGSNWKTQWKEAWKQVPAPEKPTAALRSPFLLLAYEQYWLGFQQDLNHYYSGLNAFALLTTRLTLATALPAVWNESFPDDEEAMRQQQQLQREWDKLHGTISSSLDAARARQHAGKPDMWLDIAAADLACLTSKRPAQVAQQYRNALATATAFDRHAVRQQLLLYAELNVAAANVAAALAIEALQETVAAGPAKPMHTLLFTGHLLDSATRAKPRFPAAKEGVARQAIKEAVQVELASIDGPVMGLSGGANGGDILFHEVCAELGVPTVLYLPMPPDKYVRASVQDGGPGWVARFDALYRRLPHRELSSSEQLPPWLQLKKDYSIWERNNLWMLYNALALGSSHTTLLALWDGEPTSNGPGGTQDMVAQAKASGAKTVVLPTKQLFDLD